MAEALRLDIVTPYGLIHSEEVEEVTARGTEGEFGVLPGHAPFFTTLVPGLFHCVCKGQPRYFFVASGFAEVGPDKVLILAGSAERSEDIDVERAMEAKRRAEENLKQQENVDFQRAESALARAIWRIHAAEKAEK